MDNLGNMWTWYTWNDYEIKLHMLVMGVTYWTKRSEVKVKATENIVSKTIKYSITISLSIVGHGGRMKTYNLQISVICSSTKTFSYRIFHNFLYLTITWSPLCIHMYIVFLNIFIKEYLLICLKLLPILLVEPWVCNV